MIIPTDELIFFRGVGIPPTSQSGVAVFPAGLEGSWLLQLWQALEGDRMKGKPLSELSRCVDMCGDEDTLCGAPFYVM